ncbi:hypothetical protein E1161_15150 [Saccharopolyspora aridisoli]|uniref:Uncharacterized protein n=1 Tax=Saccharopolyspora aridisoli TaxID=2530385 RepID=A0A4R4UIX7_9PSEU|nr:hypothetical protein [Saccharopolyspora aridisoli]TDC91887.1 hypothetical protein E1161_15150 [Saccharopolyspora aridisoli]
MAEGPVPFLSQARTFERPCPEISAQACDVFDDRKFSHGEQVGELALAGSTGARRVVDASVHNWAPGRAERGDLRA